MWPAIAFLHDSRLDTSLRGDHGHPGSLRLPPWSPLNLEPQKLSIPNAEASTLNPKPENWFRGLGFRGLGFRGLGV